VRATVTLTTLRTTSQPAQLPEALLYEDPSGRTLHALAEENQGTPHRNKTSRYATHRGDGKARANAITVRWYSSVRHYGIYNRMDDIEHRASIHMGREITRTWLGIIPLHASSVWVQTTSH
jgi:hypothetical protein